MDKYVSATEANQHFAEVLRDVAAGESVTVTSRGKAVAKISPPDAEKKRDISKLLEFMKSNPPVVIGPWTRDELYDRG
jgi:prevent-host-death family protein